MKKTNRGPRKVTTHPKMMRVSVELYNFIRKHNEEEEALGETLERILFYLTGSELRRLTKNKTRRCR